MLELSHSNVASVLLFASALVSCVLAAIVFFRNPTRRTHRVFSVMALLLALWSAGVLVIVHCHGEAAARFWVMLTFAVACFLPGAIYHFLCVFPTQRFEGSRAALWFLYVGAIVLVGLASTPLYIAGLQVYPDLPPAVTYGPVHRLYAALAVVCFFFSSLNLAGKLKVATGLRRRQIEHVCISFYASTILAMGTNLLAPQMDVGSLQIYGPCFMLIMMAGLAYSMVRYHLLDIWGLLSRTTVYALVTAFVIVVFLCAVSVVPMVFAGSRRTEMDVLAMVLAGGVIALVLQPLRERTQLFLDRILAHRRYDAKALIGRISREAAQFVQLDQLLAHVARDLQNTAGIRDIHVLLCAEDARGCLQVVFSTSPERAGEFDLEQDALVAYLETTRRPVVLEHLLMGRVTPERAEVAKRLAQMDTFLLAPLRTTAGLVGVLALGERLNRDPYTREDAQTFGTLAGPLAAAIENARLYDRLEKLNLHLERIMGSMRGGVVAVDARGVVTTVNQEAVELLGGVAVGQSLDDMEPKIAKVLRASLHHGSSVRDLETEIRGAGGVSTPVAVSSSTFEDAVDDRRGAMVLIYNLTQIRRLESNVRKADRLTSIGTMAAGMAHEIKNPLQSIKTFTQLLLDRYDDDDFRKTFVEVVPPEVQRIDDIVTRLLNFARPRPVVFAEQDVEAIVSNVLALVANQTRKADIEVQVEGQPLDCTVHADEQQLHQLFLNLVLNAVDAMRGRPRRQLTVRFSRGHASLPREGAMLHGVACVRVQVRDTGCGIPAENVEQLFTPFFTTKTDGSGLGLSVAQRIVAEHGGELDVDSLPDGGTTITVVLPLLPAARRKERAGV